MKILILIYLCCTTCLLAQVSEDESIRHIKSNVYFLASDFLEGRQTGTRGEDLAASFIAAEFHKSGIIPFGDNGSYFQFFPLNKITANSTAVKLSSNENKFIYGKDFIVDKRYRTNVNLNDLEIVYAGYGITAPEYSYDDYAGLNVKNKAVLIIDDEPVTSDTSFFRGSRATRYSFWGTKYNIAKEKGAAAVIILSEQSSGKEWDAIVNALSKPSLRYLATNTAQTNIPFIALSESGLNKMVGDEENYKILLEAKNKDLKAPKINFERSFSYTPAFNEETINVKNVVGILEGNDPVLKNEYIVLSAHYDHEGISNGQIYNGADDNASGTSAVIETARRLGLSKSNKRSIIFLLVTGEERGLLGSKFFSENVPYIGSVVANINMDMVGREHIDSLHVIGSDRLSTQLDILVQESNKEGPNFSLNYKFNDPADPNRFYERSDHYNFAKKNIPVAFFFDYMNEDYHEPGDDPEKINYHKIKKVVDLVELLSLKISNAENRLAVDKKP